MNTREWRRLHRLRTAASARHLHVNVDEAGRELCRCRAANAEVAETYIRGFAKGRDSG